MVLTFDIETKRLPDEVGGWKNKHMMGVACLVVLDSNDSSYHVFSPDDVPLTQPVEDVLELFDDALDNERTITGFNIWDFDFPVLEHELGINNLREKYEAIVVDPMQHIYDQLGHRLGLGDLVKLNFGESKTMEGRDAPLEWRRGNHQKVIDYCKKDVELEYRLFSGGREAGELRYFCLRSKQVKEFKVTW